MVLNFKGYSFAGDTLLVKSLDTLSHISLRHSTGMLHKCLAHGADVSHMYTPTQYEDRLGDRTPLLQLVYDGPSCIFRQPAGHQDGMERLKCRSAGMIEHYRCPR